MVKRSVSKLVVFTVIGVAGLFAAFMVGGYLMYAVLFAAIGADGIAQPPATA